MRFFVAAAASKPDIESASDADWRIAIVTLHSNPGITLVCFQSFSGI
jgi:hypothetical protein